MALSGRLRCGLIPVARAKTFKSSGAMNNSARPYRTVACEGFTAALRPDAAARIGRDTVE